MPAHRRKLVKRLLVGFAVVLAAGLIYAVMDELQTSRLQAERLGKIGRASCRERVFRVV